MALVKSNENGKYEVPKWLVPILMIMTFCSSVWAVSTSMANRGLTREIQYNRELALSTAGKVEAKSETIEVIRQDVAVIKSQVQMLLDGKVVIPLERLAPLQKGN